MNAPDPASLRRQYDADGVVKIPGLLGPAWIERLRSAVELARAELSARPDAAARPDPRYPTADFSTAPGRFTLRWLWRDSDDLRRFFTDSGVAPVVAALLGAKRLQYWFDLTFFHDPGAGGAGSPWHHDIAAFPCKGEQIPSLWIALTEVDSTMSPLRCIRGSHRCGVMYRPPVYVPQDQALPGGYAPLPDVEAALARGEMEAISWEFAPGDALLIHPSTLHGAPPNASERPRIAFTTRWAGDDVRWAPDAFSMKVPGVDLGTVPRGERPAGPFFPYVD
jgi:hypothetical protein